MALPAGLQVGSRALAAAASESGVKQSKDAVESVPPTNSQKTAAVAREVMAAAVVVELPYDQNKFNPIHPKIKGWVEEHHWGKISIEEARKVFGAKEGHWSIDYPPGFYFAEANKFCFIFREGLTEEGVARPDCYILNYINYRHLFCEALIPKNGDLRLVKHRNSTERDVNEYLRIIIEGEFGEDGFTYGGKPPSVSHDLCFGVCEHS
jgi:hypothetical protein